MKGDFPPNSSVKPLPEPAVTRRISRPTWVEPVNARDLINAWVLHQQPTGFAVPSNKVHHQGRKPHRVAQLGKA